MGDKETFSEKTLKQIRSDNQSTAGAGTQKILRMVLVIDAIFIVMILVFFYYKESGDKYHSSAMKYDYISLRFSNINKKQSRQSVLILKSDSRKLRDEMIPGISGIVLEAGIHSISPCLYQPKSNLCMRYHNERPPFMG
ncbi:MAG: hypothetical protein CVV44_03030 [Spirochaetae bacterium HGW-Spirochaetae-1]|jgi:hypothetical protein|nr:MAG: hypothetical protein CVV44_03030 [Spirochaetae bacterium HGW-Spirochaetae-1]